MPIQLTNSNNKCSNILHTRRISNRCRTLKTNQRRARSWCRNKNKNWKGWKQWVRLVRCWRSTAIKTQVPTICVCRRSILRRALALCSDLSVSQGLNSVWTRIQERTRRSTATNRKHIWPTCRQTEALVSIYQITRWILNVRHHLRATQV